MKCERRISLGAITAIAIGIITALWVALSDADAAQPDRFTVERFGEAQGRTLVFIPGLGTPGEVWVETAQTLDGVDARVVTLAGFGGAEPAAPVEQFLAANAAALADWLAEEGLEDVVLIGHSLGGQIALQTAAAAAETVSGVLVVDSAPFFAGLMNPNADPAQAQAYGAAMRRNMEAADDPAFAAMIAQGLPIQVSASDDQARVLAWAEASHRESFAQAAAEALAGDFRPGLGDVAAPVRVLVAHDTITPISETALAERYEAQYAGLARGEIRIVTSTRHFIMLDRPGAMVSEVEAFLEASR